ncbi:MAG: sugar phosphate isomerase/epimerase [Clostridia bacterium]|nr:sugar phosphate isomerase/epimerase [Clostridia bacterium]
MNTLLGQNFRFGYYDIPPADRMRAIRSAGFDSVMFWWGDDFESVDGSRYDLYDTAVRFGLQCTTVHFPSVHSDYLWYDDSRGDGYTEAFLTAIDDCGERNIGHVVIHLTRSLITPPPNEIGVRNFGRMLSAAEKRGVKIAVENTRFLNYNRLIYGRYKSEMLGFCYDCGHNNCYTPTESPLTEFGAALCTTHIHDNDGTGDQHRPMGDGTVNYDSVFSGLKALGARELNLESYDNKWYSLHGRQTMDEYLRMSYTLLHERATKYGFELD